MGKIRLKGGPKDKQVIICPDDTLMLILVRRSIEPGVLEEFTDTPEYYDRYVIDDYGVGNYMPSAKE